METQHVDTYHGLDIVVEAQQLRVHAWIWSYTIDGGKVFRIAPRAHADAEIAMRQGLGAARTRVDELIEGR